jgi:alcohol dehydrogenase class IV
MRLQVAAKGLLQGWRGKVYSFGPGALDAVGSHVAELGKTALVVASGGRWLRAGLDTVVGSLQREGIRVVEAPGEAGPFVPGARPNAPRDDVFRLAAAVGQADAEVIVAIGGGSTIDAVKAAAALAALGADRGGVEQDGAVLEALFGAGRVSSALGAAGAAMRAVVAVQTAASSAAHLTKYANVTDPGAQQKKLIVDQALVPPAAAFDYSVTASAPVSLVLDGAFDGMAHCLEVLWGSRPSEGGAVTSIGGVGESIGGAGESIDGASSGDDLIAQVATCGVELIVKYLPAAIGDSSSPQAGEARVALGLGTDLGGYAIMLGGTNGPHLNSFSLVDLASHGQACGVLNPYWAVFLAPAIEPQLRMVGDIYHRHGYLETSPADLGGRDLGRAVAQGMLSFAASLGYPTTLGELPGWRPDHIERALRAAKDPQLAMKLRNLPLPLDATQVDEYMRPVLLAAATGDFSLIREYRAG